jgi:osmotically-inducible protein OsmY
LPEGIRATVRDGVITLTGTVEHQYEKAAATNRVRDIKGVTWVRNDIDVKAQASEKVVRSRIVSALHRNADLDSRNIHVMAAGHEIWLSGTTRSLAAKGQAEASAWATPGVETVHNNIVVG